MSLPEDFCLPCGCLGTIDWDENGDLLPNNQWRPCPYCEYGKREAALAETRAKIAVQVQAAIDEAASMETIPEMPKNVVIFGRPLIVKEP